MDAAKCTENGMLYNAFDFSRLHPIDLLRMRRLLQCPECGGPAFFRKASYSGRAACFGAWPHADGCRLAAQDYIRPDNGPAGFEDALINPGCRIIVDFNVGAHDQPESVGFIDWALFQEQRGNSGGDSDRSNSRAHRRLSSLLRTLINSPVFAQSDQILEIGVGVVTARNFFMPLLDVTDKYHRRLLGFWGVLTDARFETDRKDGQLWLNGGGRNNISFCLQAHHVEQITRRYHIREIEDLAGAKVLIYGQLRISQAGKHYCVIEEPEHIALRLK
jgi:hypothetical protein